MTFTPTVAGLRKGTLTAASGFTSSLSGTGLAPATPTTTTTATTTTGQRAAALKKCKKKFPKGPKRKKCIKKAKARAA